MRSRAPRSSVLYSSNEATLPAPCWSLPPRTSIAGQHRRTPREVDGRRNMRRLELASQLLIRTRRSNSRARPFRQLHLGGYSHLTAAALHDAGPDPQHAPQEVSWRPCPVTSGTGPPPTTRDLLHLSHDRGIRVLCSH